MPDVTWNLRSWSELSRDELYSIVQLRETVFIVEQNCAYLDADGYDRDSRHLFTSDFSAYCRLVPAGTKFPSISIGRVIVAHAARGTGLARALMERAIAACGQVDIELAAQAHLEKFYGSLGFSRTGDVYPEDGIPHVNMLRCADAHDPRRPAGSREGHPGS